MNKVFKVIVSIIVAVGLWLYVDSVSNTSVTTTVKGVPVEFSGENTVLAAKDLMLLSGYDVTVDLTLKGPRRVLVNLDKAELRIVADTSSIDSVGSQTLSYQVVYPDNIQRNSISVESASMYAITVTVGNLYTKEIPIEYELIGNVAAGFIAEDLILDPGQLVLRGQRDDLLNISYAKIRVNITDAETTVVKTVEYQLYDYNDVPIENPNVRTDTQLIQAILPVKTTKEVPLELKFREVTGSTLAQTDYSINPAAVTLVGEKAVLDNIDSITLDTIYLQDMKNYQTMVYDIPVPEGTEVADGTSNTTVTIVVRGVSERQMTLTDFRFSGLPDGCTAAVVTENVTVTLRGLSTELDALTSEQVIAAIDLSGTAGPGSYTVPVKISLKGAPNVGAKGDLQVIVNVSEAEEEPPQETEETPQEQE